MFDSCKYILLAKASGNLNPFFHAFVFLHLTLEFWSIPRSFQSYMDQVLLKKNKIKDPGKFIVWSSDLYLKFHVSG